MIRRIQGAEAHTSTRSKSFQEKKPQSLSIHYKKDPGTENPPINEKQELPGEKKPQSLSIYDKKDPGTESPHIDEKQELPGEKKTPKPEHP